MPWRWDREQGLMPPSLDEVLADDHPVRLVAALVDSDGGGVGRAGGRGRPTAYHPSSNGFMTGVRSARRLETAGREQLACRAELPAAGPQHALALLPRAPQPAHTVQIAARLGGRALQAVDGTKVASASSSRRRAAAGAALERRRDRGPGGAERGRRRAGRAAAAGRPGRSAAAARGGPGGPPGAGGERANLTDPDARLRVAPAAIPDTTRRRWRSRSAMRPARLGRSRTRSVRGTTGTPAAASTSATRRAKTEAARANTLARGQRGRGRRGRRGREREGRSGAGRGP